jgi:hypothetical protein
MSTQTLRRSTRLAAKQPVAEQVEQPVAETKVKSSVTKKASSRRDLPPPLEEVYSDDESPVYPAGVKIKDIEEPKVEIKKEPVEIKKETVEKPKVEVKKESVQVYGPFYTFPATGTGLPNGKTQMFQKPLEEAIQAVEEHRKVCKVCKKSYLLDQIKNYMGTGLNISVSKAINMFTLIDKEMDFICSKDFTPDLKFMYVLHDKSVGLMNDIKRNLSTTPALRQEINALLDRVHQKTHLYIIKYEVNDPHYNKFLSQFINQYQ